MRIQRRMSIRKLLQNRQILRNVLPVLSTLAMLFSSSAIDAESLIETIKRTKPGIVGIGTYQITGRPAVKLTGTGFAVGDGRHIVTNAHVLPNLVDISRNEQLSVFAGQGKRPKVIRAEVLVKDDKHDIAILKIGQGSLPALKLGDSRKVQEGQTIAFTGFPIGAVLGLHPVTHTGYSIRNHTSRYPSAFRGTT